MYQEKGEKRKQSDKKRAKKEKKWLRPTRVITTRKLWRIVGLEKEIGVESLKVWNAVGFIMKNTFDALQENEIADAHGESPKVKEDVAIELDVAPGEQTSNNKGKKVWTLAPLK